MPKAILAKAHAVKGVFYGPGEVEVSDEVYATLERRGAFSNPLTAFPALIEAGYTDIEAARAQPDERLLELPGIGPATVKKLRSEGA